MRAMRLAVAAAIGLLLAASAQGASFDCKRAATDSEREICADPKLSAMDDELARQYPAALAQSLDPAMLRVEQVEWLAQVRRLSAPRDIENAYAVRLEALGKLQAAAEVTAAKQPVSESDARAGCLAAFAGPVAGAPCKLDQFGSLGSLDGISFAYALYGFRTPDGGSMGGRVLIFERADAQHLRILFAPETEGGPFYAPTIDRTPAGVLLHIPGYETGTGNFNRERLFIWRDRRWHDVDVTSWLDALARRLPNGLGAWKGIYPDYRKMTAATPLWRKGDSNASPTGGSAKLRLGWQGDKVVLKSLQARR